MPRSSKKIVQSEINNVKMDDQSKAELNEVNNRPKKKRKKHRNSTLTIENFDDLTNNNIQQDTQSLVPEIIISHRDTCPCEEHYAKILIEHSYYLTADRIFDSIFGSNEFVKTYREAQKLYNLTESEWKENEQTNFLERVLNYQVPFESKLLGKSTIITREKQTRVHEMAGSHYVIDTEVCNSGVQFSDTFALLIRFCIVQISPTTTKLLVTARIHYIKSVNRFIKQFIEGSAFSASQNGLKDLNVRLNRLKNSLTDQPTLVNGDVKLTDSFFEDNRQINQEDTPNSVQQLEPTITANDINTSTSRNHNNIEHSSLRSSDNDTMMVFILTAIHIYLYKKLERTDALLDTLIHLLKRKN